jgi:hypothetical protein
MSVVGPVTKSPHANTPRTLVAYVAGVDLDPSAVDLEARLDRQERQVGGLRHGRDDGLRRDDELGALDGDRRATARGVGSPSRLRMNLTPVTLPSSPSTSIGLARNSIRTPSRSVSPSSSSSTTSSDRVRR